MLKSPHAQVTPSRGELIMIKNEECGAQIMSKFTDLLMMAGASPGEPQWRLGAGRINSRVDHGVS